LRGYAKSSDDQTDQLIDGQRQDAEHQMTGAADKAAI